MKPLDHDHVRPWLDLARADLAIADLVLADASCTAEMYGLACFHAQQGAEKLLKALLIAVGRPVPRTHNLVLLTDACGPPDAVPVGLLVAVATLNEYGVGPRYPGIAVPSSEQQARAARAHADTVRHWVMTRFDGGSG